MKEKNRVTYAATAATGFHDHPNFYFLQIGGGN